MAEVGLLVAVLKLRIKEWEYSFRKQNSRLPSRHDIKQDPLVYDLYKAYKSLKDIPADAAKPKPHILDNLLTSFLSNSTESPMSNSPPISLSSNLQSKYIADISPARAKAEGNTTAGLGPTPQANGKVISILDFHSTPPYSSPLKSRDSRPPQNNESLEIFKTPTKPASRVEHVFTPVMSSSKLSSLSQKLAAASQDDHGRISATPQYLGRVNRKFEFTSAAAEPNFSSLLPRAKIFTTPTKATSEIDFLVSPSPLKSHRFMQRKLRDVFIEMQQEKDQELTPDEAALDDMMAEMEKQEGQDITAPTDVAPKRKKFTQKRTTRRFKIKARYNDDPDADHTNGLAAGQPNPDELELSEAESDDSQEEYVRPEILNPKGRAPGATNFQRLRINDPRAKKFKRRMANRRF